jgi:hypothetical protein
VVVNEVTGERAECDAVLASSLFLGPTNSSRFLRFVCERYFAGIHSVTEYEIATEALGRRPDFDPTQDSIVRVEAHRMRKRLHEYYEGEGSSHDLQLVVPQGAYLPHFIAVTPSRAPVAEPTADPDTANVVTAVLGSTPEMPGNSSALRLRSPALWLILVAVVVAAVAFGIYLLKNKAASTPANGRESVSTGATGVAASQEVLIMAGSTATSYTDHLGHVWSGDHYFSGGESWPVRYRRIRRTDDPQLFLSARQGEEFGYDIPLQPGSYELRLYFAETFYGDDNSEGGGESSRMFDVTANGAPLLTHFDPLSDAGGSNVADARVFLHIGPAADGKLHLKFQNHFQLKGVAFVNAIQLVPSQNRQMTPIRWVASNAAVLDKAGQLWTPDQFVEGGRRRELGEVTEGTNDPELYKAERYGNFSYAIPVAEDSTYAVTLYFSEHWFGIPNYGNTSTPTAGMRVFDAYCNGVTLLQDFDIYRESGGSLKALTRTFHGLRPNHQGKLMVSFVPNRDYPSLTALEVVPDGKK